VKNNKNAYAVSVVIALLLVSILLATYYIALRPPPDRYATIYLLDAHKTGGDYPELLVANQNSTFSVYVEVENHMGRTLNDTQVQMKITGDENLAFPINVNATQTFNGTIKDGVTWENIATVSLNQPGDHIVAFELWISNEKTGVSEFSGEYCVLNVKVIA
jgi:uncharacterized membrane protein